MKVQTGKGMIPFITLVAIWSVSALTSLPGLAVSPILGQLTTIFPHSSDLDIQMLTSLPSLLIIPFILLAGKLTERMNLLKLLRWGLWLFALSGVLYLLAQKMWQLVIISALLGIGSGLIIPLSTSLISHYFEGEYRTRQFGLSSAITNLTLVIATSITGYLAEVNWHLPFIVYLFPLISILLIRNLGSDFPDKKEFLPEEPLQILSDSTKEDTYNIYLKKYGIDFPALLKIMIFYGLVTYLVIIISFDLPFLLEEYGFSSGDSGIIISLFFLAIMAPGFILTDIIRILGSYTKLYSLILIAIGMACILFFHSEWLIGIGSVLMGFAYGVIQPLVYDQTTHLALPRKVTMALALVMAMNYVAILVCPFIIDTVQNLLHIKTSQFAFGFNLIITLLVIVGAIYKRKSPLFI